MPRYDLLPTAWISSSCTAVVPQYMQFPTSEHHISHSPAFICKAADSNWLRHFGPRLHLSKRRLVFCQTSTTTTTTTSSTKLLNLIIFGYTILCSPGMTEIFSSSLSFACLLSVSTSFFLQVPMRLCELGLCQCGHGHNASQNARLSTISQYNHFSTTPLEPLPHQILKRDVGTKTSPVADPA